MVEQNSNLPVYLSTIHDNLSDDYQIVKDKVLHYSPPAYYFEENDNVPKFTSTHSNFARNAAISAAVIVVGLVIAGVGILGCELYNKEKGKKIK